MYDGINWETIPVSNNTVIRSLAVDSSGKVYVGAKGDFGYLKYDNAGKTIFSSLLHTIESKDRDFLDIWNIHVVENEIYFQTESKIFKLKNNLVTVINIDNLARRSYSAGNNILMQITGKGLAQLNKDSAILIPGSEIFINKKVLSIVLYANNKLLIGTSNELFVCSFKISNDILVFDHKPKKLKTEAEKILQVNQLYHILKLNDNKYCIGTKGKGAIIIDSIGTILQNINTKNGLLADEVYYSYLDLHNNLWLGLGFGISNINIESPVTYMDETSGIKGTVLSIIKFKGVLYIGTTTGVFYLTNDGFIKISGIYNQVWDFIIIPDQNDTIIKNLYASTSDGLFLIKNNQAINIFDKLAFSFQKSNLFSNRLYIANNSNLIIGRFNQALNIKTVKEINVNAEIRNIVEDELGNLWLATNSSGIIFIKSEFFNNEEHSNSNKYITTYDTSLGLPTLNWNIPHLNKNKIVVATKKGIYTFNKEKNIFEPHIANKAFKNGTRWIYTMQINNGNIWFDSDKGRGILIKQYDGNYILSESAFQPVKSLLGDYGNKNSIYFDGFVTWFGLHKGILRFDKKVSTKYNQEFSVLLKNVFVKSDSVLFSCFLADKNLSNYTNSVPLSHQCNNPTFNYSAPFYISEENITFSYYLEGFDKQWSEWSLKSEKEYTNLPAGEYIFNIKAKNIFEKESEIFKYSFEISAPWYNHILAYFVYFILAFLIILIIVKLNIRRLKLEKINLEKIITERTKKISKQKDDITNKNIEFQRQKEEITSQKEEIIVQKEKLEIHQNHLEKIVEKRTKDLKIAKEKAEESDRLKSTFLANMSHEIRTPMNAIIGFTSLLNNPGLSDEVKRELTVHINHNSDTLLRLIDDIIDLSKIEAEQLYIEKKSCSVDKIFDTLLKVFNEKKIEIKKDHIIFKIAKNNQNKNLKIYTDFIRFRQIYSNLLSNSLKFTEEGEIEIGYTQSEAENIFYVKDTGIGLSDEQKDLIFERFSKIENHKQKMYRGAGLGLAISKNLIELLGGRIWVNSEKDKGSIFYFTIPFSNLA